MYKMVVCRWTQTANVFRFGNVGRFSSTAHRKQQFVHQEEKQRVDEGSKKKKETLGRLMLLDSKQLVQTLKRFDKNINRAFDVHQTYVDTFNDNCIHLQSFPTVKSPFDAYQLAYLPLDAQRLERGDEFLGQYLNKYQMAVEFQLKHFLPVDLLKGVLYGCWMLDVALEGRVKKEIRHDFLPKVIERLSTAFSLFDARDLANFMQIVKHFQPKLDDKTKKQTLDMFERIVAKSLEEKANLHLDTYDHVGRSMDLLRKCKFDTPSQVCLTNLKILFENLVDHQVEWNPTSRFKYVSLMTLVADGFLSWNVGAREFWRNWLKITLKYFSLSMKVNVNEEATIYLRTCLILVKKFQLVDDFEEIADVWIEGVKLNQHLLSGNLRRWMIDELNGWRKQTTNSNLNIEKFVESLNCKE